MSDKKGKLIVLEGIDGSGKSTQVARLAARFDAAGKAYKRLVFPQYEEESSALIRMYLRGDFGTKPDDVNAYAATAFYAVDRFASYKKQWEGAYQSGALFLADRYTTSNAVHQAAKLASDAREEYWRWLSDFEYQRMGLPVPDLVIYLDLPIEQSLALIASRAQAEGTQRDIHEADAAYLAACRAAALQVACLEGWLVISCVDAAGALRSIDEIHEDVWHAVLPHLD